MAKGMFDMTSDDVYKAFYITRGDFDVGRALEQHILTKYSGWRLVPRGQLKSLFSNCAGSKVKEDKVTDSRKGPDQARIALDFTANLVKSQKIDPKRITVLAPYTANVELIAK
ncbi:hypothetical protein PT974_09877 [Cladobotryum mycophilum]|uniref:DNA2/NAM7 helicase-like C-terminal domain-containing protein n=1 Tax=Cladobotryum mycophilum TaxID=491253 RepID=A0ABR0SIB7_9HYPO